MHYSTHLLRHTRFTIGKNIENRRRLHQLSIAELSCLIRIACALQIEARQLLP